MRNMKILWGVITVLLIAVVILSSVLFADFFNQPNVESNPQTDNNPSIQVVATIGDKTITSKDLEQQLMQKHGRETLSQMVDHEVIRMEGKARGTNVEESEIQKELKRMQQGYDSEAQFYDSMKEQLGMTREALKADVKDKLMLEKIATAAVNVSDEQIDAYLQAHADEFKPKVQLRLQQIVVSSKTQAAKVTSDLSSGIDFAQVAKERSLDDATRDSGGDLGWIEEGDPFLEASLMKAAGQLKPGDITKPIELDGHLYILKLKDRKEEPAMTKEAIRDTVRKELALSEAPPLKEVMKTLREKWKVAITL